MTHSPTTYTPLWYKPENIGKYNISRQTNIDKISPLPRLSLVKLEGVYGEYELELLSKADSYGLELPRFSNGEESFADLEYLISLYEALDEEGLEIAERARIWHMPIKQYHLEDINKLRLEAENYEKRLDEASILWIGWDTSTYDPQGLIEAIAEASGAAEEEYRNYRKEVNAYYNASRGV
jgi:hypothetical protein